MKRGTSCAKCCVNLCTRWCARLLASFVLLLGVGGGSAALIGCAVRSHQSDIDRIEATLGFRLKILEMIGGSNRRFDFDGDARPDMLAVIAHPQVDGSRFVSRSAFGYGNQEEPGSRCLLAALADSTQWNVRNGIQVLCGLSPIIVLSADRTAGSLAQYVAVLAHEQVVGYLGPTATEAALGDAVILQTQASDSVLFWTDSGFHWREPPNAE